MISIKEIESFKDYGKVLSISNGVIEAYVTLDVGPRVIRFGYIGGQNIVFSDREAAGARNDGNFEDFYGKGKKWENLGGHRIWIAPEAYPQTYYPDCDKVDYELTENGAIFTPKAETENGVAKQLEVTMDPDDCNLQVTMRVKNISDKTLKFSIWGLTVGDRGGAIIIPLNNNDTGLLPNRTISVWSYSDISDDRIYWGNRYVTVRQDVAATSNLKLGFDLNRGTVYYIKGEDVFCKSYPTYHPHAEYPDGGSSFETYTDSDFIEVESLGEYKEVAPGETSELTERWALCKKPCEVDLKNETSIENLLSKL